MQQDAGSWCAECSAKSHSGVGDWPRACPKCGRRLGSSFEGQVRMYDAWNREHPLPDDED